MAEKKPAKGAAKKSEPKPAKGTHGGARAGAGKSSRGGAHNPAPDADWKTSARLAHIAEHLEKQLPQDPKAGGG